MRVLIVTQFYPPTIVAQEKVIQDLCGELMARGHRVTVATLGQEDEPWCSYVSDVRVYRIRSTFGRLFSHRHVPPAVDPRAMRELRSVITLERPDIVQGNDWLLHSVLPLKRRDGPGLVVTLHDYSLVCANKRLVRGSEACNGPGPVKCLRCSSAYYGGLKGSAITLGNWTMSAAERALVDMFLPVSRAVADAARLQEHGNPHSIIPNFVPSAHAPRLDTEQAPGDLAKSVLDELPSEFVFFAGDIMTDKGVGILLKAHEQLETMPLRRSPPLVLMGPILDPDLLEASTGSVRVFEPQPYDVVFRALRRCTVAVLPSLVPEASSLVVLQAMNAGRAVIAASVGGLPELITDGEDGILVPPGDVSALRDALARLLADPALRARLGASAALRAADFSAERIVPQVERAYEDVLTSRRKRVEERRRRLPKPAAGGRVRVAANRVTARLQQASQDLLAARRRHLTAARMSTVGGSVWRGLHRREPRVILILTALGVAGTALPAGAWLPVRVILVFPLLLVLPGYALTNAIFPRRTPGWVERTALALSLSLVTAALVSLFLYVTPFDLTRYSWAVLLALVTAAAVIAEAARTSTTPDEAMPLRPPLRLPRRRIDIAVAVAAAGVIAAAVVLARTPLPSPSAHGYTALWLTREPGSSALILGVRSEEHRRTRYRLRLVVAGHAKRREFALAPGQTWQKRLPAAGEAAASLYRIGDPRIYRSVRLAAPAGR